MLRRILLYCLIGALLYFAYTRYIEYASSVQLREAARQEEENRRALRQARDSDGQSKVERALRRRETTEEHANQAERQQ